MILKEKSIRHNFERKKNITENDSAFLISRRVNSHTYLFDIHLLLRPTSPIQWERDYNSIGYSDTIHSIHSRYYSKYSPHIWERDFIHGVLLFFSCFFFYHRFIVFFTNATIAWNWNNNNYYNHNNNNIKKRKKKHKVYEMNWAYSNICIYIWKRTV